jgi:glutaredoxin
MLRDALCLLAAAGLLLGASGELSDRRAPGFALPDPSYEHYYCPHCLLASTTLEQVKARYGDKVAILEVVLPPDNQQTIAKFIQTNNVTVPVLCDMGQMTASYFKATPATMQKIEVPHLFLIDKRGIIRNDFAYEESTRSIFEGAGLFAEIEKLLK